MARQQNKPMGVCPRCGQHKMRSGQGRYSHGKVDNVQVCDDCVVESIYEKTRGKS